MTSTSSLSSSPMRAPSSRRAKVAIVTGASSGIGLALAQKLIARGYWVVAKARKITSAETLRATDDLKLVDGDMGTQKTAYGVVGTAIQECGRVDLLVNTAGICIPKPCTDSNQVQMGTSRLRTPGQGSRPGDSMKV